MSDSMASLRRKLKTASDLQSVVRTMKALAASNIGQYEKSVVALVDYYRAVELGLGACFRKSEARFPVRNQSQESVTDPIGAIVFGSDQGLVGQFNEVVAELAVKTLSSLTGIPQVWSIGERVHACLVDRGISPIGLLGVPNSVKGISPLIGRIQVESERRRTNGESPRVYVFYNRLRSGSLYEPCGQRLLPLDSDWRQNLVQIDWPTRSLPEILGVETTTLKALIREYLFISLFRACAESLASENASRLSAMERAERNIDELIENLHGSFHRLRQGGIDEELFDVISGFEALGGLV